MVKWNQSAVIEDQHRGKSGRPKNRATDDVATVSDIENGTLFCKQSKVSHFHPEYKNFTSNFKLTIWLYHAKIFLFYSIWFVSYKEFAEYTFF